MAKKSIIKAKKCIQNIVLRVYNYGIEYLICNLEKVMNVPLMVNTDVLVAGASTDAIQLALEAKKAGLRVFVISGYTYLGENICPAMNFWDESLAMFGELFPEWPERVPTPMSVKRKLEHMLIENDIPFLFETHVLRLMRDTDGAYAGALIGNRSGLQIIRANMIIDGTERSLVARQTRMPFKPFVPGMKNIERIVFVDEQSDYDAPAMSVPFHLDGKPLFARKFSATLNMPDCSPGAFAAAELEMRHLSWSDAIIGSADRCLFTLEDSSCGHDPEAFVFIPGQLRGEGGIAEASISAHGEPCAIATLPDGVCKTSPMACGFVPSFRYADKRSCVVPDAEWAELGAFDVLVAGGGTGGAAAGVGAARSGADTLVIESKSHLGGVGTEGRIAAYWFGNRVGFTAEVDKGVEALGGSVQDCSRKWKVEHKQQYWQDTAVTSGCHVWFDTLIVAVEAVAGVVRSLICASPYGIGVVKAHAVVDATGNADVAAPAGAETFYSDALEPALQGTGMPPAIPGVSSFNSDYTFSVDSDVEDITRTCITARELYADKFDGGRLVDTRERRRIVGDLCLQPMDFYLDRSYYDTLNIASSNFDTHGFTVHPIFTLRPPHEEPLSARVPLRTMLPRGVENVIVTGLGMSSHRDALPVVRMQADVQNQGYAAGIAAAMAVSAGGCFRRIDVKALQRELVNIGILPAAELEAVDSIDLSLDPVAAAFADPEGALPGLRERFLAAPSLDDALLLAFLGDAGGRELLREYIAAASWDKGWHYTGMHQFGASCSRLDTVIMALAGIAEDADAAAVGRLAGELRPEHEFSHYRSCAMFYCVHPAPDAVPVLEALLEMPGMRNWALVRRTQLYERVIHDIIDTDERNHMLKEFYMAMALFKCAPENPTANQILTEYASGMHGLFARYAAVLLKMIN